MSVIKSCMKSTPMKAAKKKVSFHEADCDSEEKLLLPSPRGRRSQGQKGARASNNGESQNRKAMKAIQASERQRRQAILAEWAKYESYKDYNFSCPTHRDHLKELMKKQRPHWPSIVKQLNERIGLSAKDFQNLYEFRLPPEEWSCDIFDRPAKGLCREQHGLLDYLLTQYGTDWDLLAEIFRLVDGVKEEKVKEEWRKLKEEEQANKKEREKEEKQRKRKEKKRERKEKQRERKEKQRECQRKAKERKERKQNEKKNQDIDSGYDDEDFCEAKTVTNVDKEMLAVSRSPSGDEDDSSRQSGGTTSTTPHIIDLTDDLVRTGVQPIVDLSGCPQKYYGTMIVDLTGEIDKWSFN